jgi:ppGpp synthetase/RelA/SpoT-type nucleotidyltranferase
MSEVKFEYSISKVKNAGKILRDQEPGSKEFGDALEVFANWRKCHSVPLNTFYESLQQYALAENPSTYVVHRPKRIDAVIKKLKRDPNAQLSTMQDIAGCRAIVKSISDVEPLIEACKQMWSEHALRQPYDYIGKPNPKTGYRGVHLVFKYKSNNPAFDGRLIEVQIRTREQHAWATAVETVDLIERQSLKSGEGDRQWQRFFALMSSAIANSESMPPVPNTPTDLASLISELRRYADGLHVKRRLQTYGAITRLVKRSSEITTSDVQDTDRFWFFLIQIDPILPDDKPDSLGVTVAAYREQEVQRAYQDVANAEHAGKNVVLAGAIDFEQLKEAYPNWFVDTHHFLMILSATFGEDIHYHV